VAFQIHLSLEDNELLLQTFFIQTQEVLLLKMVLKSVVVDKVFLLPVTSSAVANVTPFMLVSAVSVELVIPVETYPTKSAFGVAFETALVNCTGVVISKLLMLAQLGHGEQLMLVGENLLVPSTQIAGYHC
jgi:hypothetical protein